MQDLVVEFLDEADKDVLKACEDITADRKAREPAQTPTKKPPLTRGKSKTSGEKPQPFNLDAFILNKRKSRSPTKGEKGEENHVEASSGEGEEPTSDKVGSSS